MSTFRSEYLYLNYTAGVIFVHDLSQRRTKASLQKWAAEIAATGTFTAPSMTGGPGGLTVPYIVIGNKADVVSKEGRRVSSGNLVDVAREWVEKQGLLPSSDEIPLTESFPGSGGLVAVSISRKILFMLLVTSNYAFQLVRIKILYCFMKILFECRHKLITLDLNVYANIVALILLKLFCTSMYYM